MKTNISISWYSGKKGIEQRNLETLAVFTRLSLGCRVTEFESTGFTVRQISAVVWTVAHCIHVTLSQLCLLCEYPFLSVQSEQQYHLLLGLLSISNRRTNVELSAQDMAHTKGSVKVEGIITVMHAGRKLVQRVWLGFSFERFTLELKFLWNDRLNWKKHPLKTPFQLTDYLWTRIDKLIYSLKTLSHLGLLWRNRRVPNSKMSRGMMK